MTDIEALKARLLKKARTDSRTGCWIWTGRLSPDGYARTDLDRVSVHETMWVLRAIQFRPLVLEEFNRLAKKKEHGERIAAAEAQGARRAAAEIPAPPLLHELVVTA